MTPRYLARAVRHLEQIATGQRPTGYVTDFLILERAIALIEAGGDTDSGCPNGPWCLTCNLANAFKALCQERGADPGDHSPAARALAVVKLRVPRRRPDEPQRLATQADALACFKMALEDVR